jgi:signal transduction histidine kinase
LAQVVTNLVNNAINYTQDGAVQLYTCYDERRSAVGLAVQDTGLGIAAEDLPHIFQRFYRGQRVGQSNLPGTGLGLGIVKEIVAQHGGTIEVESQVGQGSTFRVWLPLNVPAGASPDISATADISGAVLHG